MKVSLREDPLRSFFAPVFPFLPLSVSFPEVPHCCRVHPLFVVISSSSLLRPSRRQFCQSVCRSHPVPPFRPVRIPRESWQGKLLDHERGLGWARERYQLDPPMVREKGAAVNSPRRRRIGLPLASHPDVAPIPP